MSLNCSAGTSSSPVPLLSRDIPRAFFRLAPQGPLSLSRLSPLPSPFCLMAGRLAHTRHLGGFRERP
eukprot:2538727-Prorocentrum_lima.AAC.1